MQNSRFAGVSLRLAAWPAVGLAIAAAWWVDRNHAQAGLAALLFLTLTTGFFHGALDAVILLRKSKSVARALAWALAYLVAVVLLGLAFASHAGAALALLLLLSVWHFGEPFERGFKSGCEGGFKSGSERGSEHGSESGSECAFDVGLGRRFGSGSALEKHGTRVVSGGASVFLPALTSANQLEAASKNWIDLTRQWAWPAWQALAWTWLALVIVWTLLYAKDHWRTARWTLAEVAVLASLNFLLTPLMAFALFFGLYHAPVHILRVARACAVRNILMSRIALATLGATFVLGFMLLAGLGPQSGESWKLTESLYIDWLAVALLALTVPHLVLVSHFAPWLSGAPDPART